MHNNNTLITSKSVIGDTTSQKQAIVTLTEKTGKNHRLLNSCQLVKCGCKNS